jgi:hypothetical protein
VGRLAPERYAAVAGAALALLGIVGFFYSSSFGSPGDVEAVFGLFDVNGWLNLVHILTGALGLLAFAAGPRSSRLYAAGAGCFYLLLGIWGIVVADHDSVLGFLPNDSENTALYLALGLSGLTVATRAGSKLSRA